MGGTAIIASDGRCSKEAKSEGFALSLEVPTKTEADRLFNALAAGRQIQAPLVRTIFPRFGMVLDRFGVLWLVLVRTPQTPPHPA